MTNTFTETETKTLIITKHKIFCDKCNKELATVKEYDDGYFPNNYEHEESVFLNDKGWLVYRKDLCLDCYKKMSKDLYELLKSFGFEEK